MAEQFAKYHEVQEDAEKLFRDTCLEPHQPILMPLKKHISLNITIDKTSSHMAEKLMHGSLFGIVDMARSRREFASASTSAKDLAQKLLDIEEGNFLSLQKYL